MEGSPTPDRDGGGAAMRWRNDTLSDKKKRKQRRKNG